MEITSKPYLLLYGIKKINQQVPFLYFSNTKLTDKNLNFIGWGLNKKINVSSRNALVENVVTGCTCIINDKLMKILIEKDTNYDNILMHDWWMYLVASHLGQIYYEPNSYIKYRQHENNVCGIQKNIYKKILKKCKNFTLKRKKDSIAKQNLEFIKNYENDILKSDYQEIKVFFRNKKLKMRILNVLKINYFRQTKKDTFIFKLLYILGYC